MLRSRVQDYQIRQDWTLTITSSSKRELALSAFQSMSLSPFDKLKVTMGEPTRCHPELVEG
jgi:hypothetical protein